MNTKTISISIFKLVLPLFVLLFVQFAANAQVLNMNGTWEIFDADGNKTGKFGTITMSGMTLTIDNGEGSKSKGSLSESKITGSDGGLNGSVSSADGIVIKIRWSNGATWKKMSTAFPSTADDLNGVWTIFDADGNKTPKIVTIRHSRPIFGTASLACIYFINGKEGRHFGVTYRSHGIFINASRGWQNGEPIDTPEMSGKVLQNGTKISWSDNTVWEKTNQPMDRLGRIQSTTDAQGSDLSGTWTGYFGQGNLRPSPKAGTITQQGSTLTIDNGEGSKSNGSLSGTTITATEWGITGIVTEDGKRINWSNDTHWRKKDQSIENTPTTTVLSAYDMNLVMSWIAAHVSSQRLSFCYKQSFIRDAGVLPTTCADGWELVGGRCHKKCSTGYSRNGVHCNAVCPQGFTDIGLYCQKPAPYGRGTGWAGYSAVGGKTAIERCEEGNRTSGDGGSPAGQSCEMWGAYAYPKCKTGFHNVGANICSPNCPYNWQDTGTGCKKPTETRDPYGVALGCTSGKEKDSNGLCYNKCNKTDYSGFGPACWQNCPSHMPVSCGAGCATTKGECAMAVTDMVISPIMAAISLATLGGASGVTVTGNTIKGAATQTATKASGIIAKMKAIYAKIELEVKAIKLTNNAYKISNSIISERDLVFKEFSDNFAEMTSYEIDKTLEERLHPKQLAEVKLEWAKRHFYLMGQTNADATLKNALTIASVIDPSGLLAVENAFYHPVCKNNTPFPIIAHDPFLN